MRDVKGKTLEMESCTTGQRCQRQRERWHPATLAPVPVPAGPWTSLRLIQIRARIGITDPHSVLYAVNRVLVSTIYVWKPPFLRSARWNDHGPGFFQGNAPRLADTDRTSTAPRGTSPGLSGIPGVRTPPSDRPFHPERIDSDSSDSSDSSDPSCCD